MREASQTSAATQSSMANEGERLPPTPGATPPVQNIQLATVEAAVANFPLSPTTSPPSLLSSSESSLILHSENLSASHGTPTPSYRLNHLPVSSPSSAALSVKTTSKRTSPSNPPERSSTARRVRKLTKRAEESKKQQLEQPQRRQVPKKDPSTFLAEREQANGNSDSTTTAVSEEFGSDIPNHIAPQSPAPHITSMDLLCVVASSELDTIEHMPETSVRKPTERQAAPSRAKRLPVLRQYKDLTELFCPLLMREVPPEVDLTDPIQNRIWTTSPAAQILMLDRFQRIEVDSRMNARYIGNEKLTMTYDWHRLDHEQRQRILDYSVSKTPKSRSKVGKQTRKR
jgi:hypothetical protein